MWQELFIEGMLSKTLWQFASDVRYFAMLNFGGYPMLVPTVAVAAGAVVGSYLNNLAGVALAHFQHTGHLMLSQERYDLWQKRMNWLVWPVGLVSWFYLSGVLVCAAGFLRVSQWKILAAIFAGQAGYYGYHYVNSLNAVS